MVSWAIGGLIALFFALKLVAIGALVLACLAVWVIFRVLFRTVGSVSKATYRRSERRVVQAYADSARRPVCRYDEVQPGLQPAAVLTNPSSSTASGRRSSSSWVFWGVLGVVAVVVVLGMRSRGRSRAEDRFSSATSDNVRPVSVAKKTEKRNNNRKAASATAPVTTTAERRPAPPKDPAWTFVGVGETLEYAKEDASAKAWEHLVAYLQNEHPSLEWTPSRDFVERNLARSWGAEEPEYLEEVGKVIKVPLHVELTPQVRDLIVKHDKHYRVEQRMTWLGKLVAGLVALLAGVAGYVRLDEWSKGYYTGALRFAAAVFVLVSAAGMWLLVAH